MKKFLKVFSVVALLCCCMFSFVGCDIFKEDDKTENEYASLIAERKIVREVVNNAKSMLTSNIEPAQEPVAQSAGVSAKTEQDKAQEILMNGKIYLQVICTVFDELVNDFDFVPGKLYSFMIASDAYYIANAYISANNIVTLNYWASETNDVANSVFESVDIYYNEKHEVIKLLDYGHDYDGDVYSGETWEDFDTTEMTFSTSGEVTYYRYLNWGTNYEDNLRIIEDGMYKEYREPDFTDEIKAEFDSAKELVNKRTSLFAYARPLSQEAQDKISDIILQ